MGTLIQIKKREISHEEVEIEEFLHNRNTWQGSNPRHFEPVIEIVCMGVCN